MDSSALVLVLNTIVLFKDTCYVLYGSFFYLSFFFFYQFYQAKTGNYRLTETLFMSLYMVISCVKI